MDKIRIRPAAAKDASVIEQLLQELEQALDAQDEVRRKPGDILLHGFGEFPLFEALIAWRGEEPVGLALFFREFSTWRGSPGVYVQDLYVSGSTRGMGLGRQLIDALIKRSRSWDATYCKLSVYHENEAAISFYRHLGFHVSEMENVLVNDY